MVPSECAFLPRRKSLNLYMIHFYYPSACSREQTPRSRHRPHCHKSMDWCEPQISIKLCPTKINGQNEMTAFLYWFGGEAKLWVLRTGIKNQDGEWSVVSV